MSRFLPQRRKGAKKKYREQEAVGRSRRDPACFSFLLLIFLLCAFASLRETSSRVSAQTAAPERVRLEAHAFRLEDVRLLDGPFKRAMLRDAEYLLRLDSDRLLSGFRKEAGLKPKAEQHRGWTVWS